MVQREVADRLFASPSTKSYGAVSVLVQLVCERTGFHPVSRTVFRPPPNVDSALVAFRRVALPQDFARIKKVVAAGFAHRRKTLPNSLELAGLASRAEAVDALATIGRNSATRAEALTPPELVAFTAALG
jgi:16S rRNA (adenine1518-N6/adenine1519-N6)-dimethyltransferase